MSPSAHQPRAEKIKYTPVEIKADISNCILITRNSRGRGMDVGDNGVRPLFAACIRISNNGEEPLCPACMASIRISAEQANMHDKAKHGQRSAPLKRECTILDSAEEAPCISMLANGLLMSMRSSNER
jgi:hypothetical protein